MTIVIDKDYEYYAEQYKTPLTDYEYKDGWRMVSINPWYIALFNVNTNQTVHVRTR